MSLCKPTLLRCFVTLSAALGLASVAASAHATPQGDSSRCHSIQNADQRHLCLALAQRDASRCHSVRNDDARHGCLAQIRGDRSRCHSIRDRDQREMCLALVHQ